MVEIKTPTEKQTDPFIPLEMHLSRPREDYIAMRTNSILRSAKSPDEVLLQLTELNKEIRKKDRASAFNSVVRSLLSRIRL